MFKSFTPSTDLSTSTPCKSSAQRAMCAKILEQYPGLSKDVLELVLPSSSSSGGGVVLIKGKDNNVTFVVSPVLRYAVFFQVRDGPYVPTLRFLHSVGGDFMPKLGVDKGGIPFVLKGAPVFVAGLASKGGMLPPVELPSGSLVQVMGEGKELPMAVGVTRMSTSEMRAPGASGTGVETLHVLGDDLWKALGGEVWI